MILLFVFSISLILTTYFGIVHNNKQILSQKEAQEQVERARYLNSQQFKDKIRRIKEDRESMTYAAWVEENTGIGKERGGTCIRPDIFLTWNNRACDGCQAYEYCLCHNRRLSHEKRKPKRR